jgi:hypothetical protein
MSAVGLMPMSYRIIGVVVFLAVLSGGSAALRWRFQDWRWSAAGGTGSVQRIIAIIDAGSCGLIALQACQAYIRALAR